MNIWRTIEDFRFDLRLRCIINVIPLVLCLRLWDNISPDLCHFQILLYNFFYNVQHISGCLENILHEPFEPFSIFLTILGVLKVFSCPYMSKSFKYLFIFSFFIVSLNHHEKVHRIVIKCVLDQVSGFYLVFASSKFFFGNLASNLASG